MVMASGKSVLFALLQGVKAPGLLLSQGWLKPEVQCYWNMLGPCVKYVVDKMSYFTTCFVF